MLTESQLRVFLPALTDPLPWVASINAAATRFAITTPARLAPFLAQTAHESAGFRRLVEGLSYSAKRLTEVWPKRFPTLESAQPYEHQPEKLANHVYGGRNGNGDEASGDGWRYRGRGLIQLTFRDNYLTAEHALGQPFVLEPDRVARPAGAALTAAHFWDSHRFNALADQESEAAFDAISQGINGGSAGLLERRALWAKAKAALA